MTVTVTLPDGHTDEYLRSGDNYVKHQDGSLDVVRGGARHPWSYRGRRLDRSGRRSKRMEEAQVLARMRHGDPTE